MEMEVFKVKDDVQADKMLSNIMELQAEKSRFEMIYNARVDQLKENLAKEVDTIDREVSFKKGMLQAYFLTIKPKETKTQKTYKLLSGKLVMKKASASIAKDDEEKLIVWAKGSKPEFIKTKEEINWGELKKTLRINGDNIITEDGEIAEGVIIQEKGEEFEVKI